MSSSPPLFFFLSLAVLLKWSASTTCTLGDYSSSSVTMAS
jgi:hypothetical protein